MPSLNPTPTGPVPATVAEFVAVPLSEAALMSTKHEEVGSQILPIHTELIDIWYVGVPAALIGVYVVVSVIRMPYGLARVKIPRPPLG
jgi:hypothetical protein